MKLPDHWNGERDHNSIEGAQKCGCYQQFSGLWSAISALYGWENPVRFNGPKEDVSSTPILLL